MSDAVDHATQATANTDLTDHVWRFEQLVALNSDRLRRIELLLAEIEADDRPSASQD
jgi:hypothetical protein